MKALENCEALRDLTPAEQTAILSLGQAITAAAGETIAEEGSPGTGFYFLLSGRVAILKDGREITQLESGAVLGEMSLFNQNVRTSTVRAVEPCSLLFIPAPEFIALVLQPEPAAVKVMQALGQLMVRRLEEREADLLQQADRESQEATPAIAEFSSLRRRLLADWALQYHAMDRPGKLATVSSKPVGTAADLSVAYSPGVAEPCIAISKDPERVYDYTSRSHLVGVITNGTAVLGLGNIGPSASKPVMEGKAVLFKRFAELDAFDIEVDETDPERFVEIVCALAPTFGGINLEDIRSPECFLIEEACRKRLDIPVFHDDQHGTAIIVGAALLNALDVVGKRVDDVRVVFSGAGAAGLACAKHFLVLGVRREYMVVTDLHGVVHTDRAMGNYLQPVAAETEARTLADVMPDADVFVGASAGNVLRPELLAKMSRNPVVFALALPEPEIPPLLALQTRSDVVLATGLSEYPNQINNVIAFPYLFRGALDVRARAIDEEMMIAATRAIASLARLAPTSDTSMELPNVAFGRDFLLPRPFDRRLLTQVSPAVAEAAMHSGAARRAVDMSQYRRYLERLAQAMREAE
jgi:malate dehydrogenase (oxaloacetate-decarboxylating)(NADP+)